MIRNTATAALALLTTSPLWAQDAFDAMPETLDAYRWEARPVLIFADTADDPSLISASQAMVNAAEALMERDIVVMIDPDPSAEGAIRQGLEIDGFTMVLVGKDGGVKMRSDGPIAVETLFETIDAMPMRKQEMREG